MKKIAVATLLVLGTLMGSSSFAKPPTNQAALVGVWSNTNPATRSIVRVVIRRLGTGITVQPFGACLPTPCNHGVLAASAYSQGVASAVSIGFNANRNFGFKATSYNGFLRSQILTLLTQDTFAPADTRYNYTVMETFKKIGPASIEDIEDVDMSRLDVSDFGSDADAK